MCGVANGLHALGVGIGGTVTYVLPNCPDTHSVIWEAQALNPVQGGREVGSIGLRLPYQEMKIVQFYETGQIARDLPDGTAGALVVRGPNVFPGYLEREGGEPGPTSEGWLDTGDLGWRDKDGCFWLTGRTKDLIIRGGHNIDASLIEQAFAAHPAILYVAAIAQPDAYAGELPCAYIEVAPKARVTAAALKSWARTAIGERAAVPAHVVILEALPKTAVGKIFKPDLRRLAKQRVFAAALETAVIRAIVSVEPSGNGEDVARFGTCQRLDARHVLGGFTVPYELAECTSDVPK